MTAVSLIVSEVYEALVSAGAPQEQAKAAAGAIPAARDLATKQDIVEVRAEAAEHRAAAKQDLAEVRAEMATKLDIAEVRAEMATKQDLAEVRADSTAMKRDIAVLKFAVFTFLPTMFLLLLKLVFFP